jgi:cytoskeletal protein CcmA (bactofilin family)
MKTLIAILLLIVLGITCNAQNLDGKWKGKMTGPNGGMELLFTFKVDADSLSGNVSSDRGTLPLENGKVNGNEFSFDVNVNGQVFSNTGVLDGDIIKLSSPRIDQPIVLSRVKEEAKIDGKWMGKFNGPQGDVNLTFTFKVDADSLSGNVSSDMGTLPIQNGKVNGNKFSYEIDINGRIMSNTGVLEGDTIKLSSPRRDQPMILTRIKEESKINGTWIGKVSGPQGDFELKFTFKVDGNKLTGKSSSSMGEVDLTNGIVNGNEFSFDVDAGGMTIGHKCKYLANDTIEVNADVNGQEMAMKLTRAAQ